MIKGVIDKLLDTSGVTSLVGYRVYPVRRQQSSPLPDITVTTVSGQPVYTSDGESGLSNGRVQIDCWGATYISAKTVAEAVKQALSAFVGSSGAIEFQSVLLESESDLSEGGSNSAEYIFRTTLDFNLWYK